VKPLRLTMLAAPLALAAGCLLPSFETLDEPTGSGGTAGTGGTSGGSGGKSDGGAPPQGGEPNAGGQAGEGPVTPLVVEDDTYVVLQDSELVRIESQGVLSNDSGDGITVTGVTPVSTGTPSSYAPEFAVEPDGSFSFVPVPEFFGAFEATYEVSDSAGNTAEGRVTIYVQPREVEVATLEDGVGGFCLVAAGADGVGSAVAGVGDTDGDGLDDFAVGAPEANSNAGRVYLVRGAVDGEGFELTTLTPEADETRYFAIDGVANSELGDAVSGAGDLDGDTLDDFLVGAPGTANADGAVHVIHGVGKPAAQQSIGDADAVDFAGGNNDNVGQLVAGGYDLDGDDVPDPVIVADVPVAYRGRYYVADGSTMITTTLNDQVPHIVGAADDDYEHQGAASIGDVDDDGNNDLLLASASVIAVVRGPVSAFPDDLGLSFTADDGWVLDRSAAAPVSVAGAGDIDGDGVNDVLFCDGVQSCKIVFGPVEDLIAGLSIEGFSGTTLLTASADLTGEGTSEALFSDGENVYVVFGGGLEKDGSFDITDLPNGDGFVVTGAGAPIASLAPVGDLNGDGHQDLAFGIPTAPGTDARVCVMYGTPKAP
jgi:hypothetical protein